MNALLSEMRRSMEELQLGLDGALNMSDKMEALARGIATNSVGQAATTHCHSLLQAAHANSLFIAALACTGSCPVDVGDEYSDPRGLQPVWLVP
jgi:hypothetical protein